MPSAARHPGGLAGARVPHQLSLVTGLHTGDVPLTVSWDEHEPPLDDAWTDAVEVSWELRKTPRDCVAPECRPALAGPDCPASATFRTAVHSGPAGR